MTSPTLHPERRHCLGCRLLQPINCVLECLDLHSWRPSTPPDASCKVPDVPLLRIVGKHAG